MTIKSRECGGSGETIRREPEHITVTVDDAGRPKCADFKRELYNSVSYCLAWRYPSDVLVSGMTPEIAECTLVTALAHIIPIVKIQFTQ